MAVLQMEKLHLCAMNRDSKQILELLQRRGAVEVHDAGEEDAVFLKTDTSAVRLLLGKNAAAAGEAVESLNKLAPAKGGGLAFLHGRTPVTLAENEAFEEKRDFLMRIAQRILQLRRAMDEAKGEMARAEAQIEALKPWMTLPVGQTFAGTKKTAVFIGTLEGERSLEGILTAMAEAVPQLEPVHVEIVSQTKQQTCILVLALKAQAQQAEEALRAIGFSRPAGASRHVPAEQKRCLEEKYAQAQKAAADAEQEIISLAPHCTQLKYLEDNLKMRAERYEVVEKLMMSRHVFVLSGYIPAVASAAAKQELEQRFDCAVELEAADAPGAEVPVKLKNSWFTEPLEGVLDAYSMPGKGEVDPTGVMSIFYYIMFGLMFSDAGYGLIMFGVCAYCYFRFKKNLEPNWSRNIRLFMWCGLSTVIWGIVFSSYFGDVVDVISTTFFGKTVSIPPLWFSPMQNPMLLLVFCLGIGTIHLSAGYIMKGITCAKNKDYVGILYDAVTPLAAWYPLLVVFMGSTMFGDMAGFMLHLPAIATPICLGITALAVVVTILTSGRESKNWGKRLLKGVYGVYNLLSGWLSDTLSYSRLLALGLATGVIASVMNQMGALMGKGVVGVIVFIVVFAVGQAMNFGINVLGAYVHSNRLEYVEFFGKFYDGGGRKFAPFGMHTTYYKIVEEETSK